MVNRTFVVIGDIHALKNFPSLKSRKYSSYTISKLWTDRTFDYIISTIKSLDPSIVKEVVFLGDIFDYPSLLQSNLNYFEGKLEEILGHTQTTITILVGNHDTTQPGRKDKTPLSLIRHKKIRVLVEPVMEHGVLYLPYAENFDGFLYNILPKIESDIVIFSHNRIFHSDSWYGKPTLPFSQLKLLTKYQVYLFNGHMHRTHCELPNYFQLGSVSPTSFKEVPYSHGLCLWSEETRSFLLFRNTTIMFVSVSTSTDTLKEFLEECRKQDCAVFLRLLNTPQIDTLLTCYEDVVLAYQV